MSLSVFYLLIFLLSSILHCVSAILHFSLLALRFSLNVNNFKSYE